MLYLGLAYIAAAFGAGLCLFAAAAAISKLASAALDGTARQPEAAGALRTSMIIPAALIEGLGFFALVICLLVALNLGLPKGAETKAAAHGEKAAVAAVAPAPVAAAAEVAVQAAH